MGGDLQSSEEEMRKLVRGIELVGTTCCQGLRASESSVCLAQLRDLHAVLKQRSDVVRIKAKDVPNQYEELAGAVANSAGS